MQTAYPTVDGTIDKVEFLRRIWSLVLRVMFSKI